MFFSQKKLIESWVEEQRLEPRILIPDLLTLRLKKKGFFKPTTEGKSRDLANHGIRFATSTRFKKGQVFYAAWEFPAAFQGEREIRVLCKAIAVAKSRADGIFRVSGRFIQMTPSQEELLKQFIWWFELQDTSAGKVI